jgi:hypothetical protein
MAGSHVWVTRFSIVHAQPESGYVYQRYPSTGFRCCNPGARYPYTTAVYIHSEPRRCCSYLSRLSP